MKERPAGSWDSRVILLLHFNPSYRMPIASASGRQERRSHAGASSGGVCRLHRSFGEATACILRSLVIQGSFHRSPAWHSRRLVSRRSRWCSRPSSYVTLTRPAESGGAQRLAMLQLRWRRSQDRFSDVRGTPRGVHRGLAFTLRSNIYLRRASTIRTACGHSCGGTAHVLQQRAGRCVRRAAVVRSVSGGGADRLGRQAAAGGDGGGGGGAAAGGGGAGEGGWCAGTRRARGSTAGGCPDPAHDAGNAMGRTTDGATRASGCTNGRSAEAG
jgi:hypothetical protein